MIYYFKNKADHKRTLDYITNKTPYNFVKVLGEGSYGVAYLLEHKTTMDQFVLKRLKAKHYKHGLAKFNQEVEFIKQLSTCPVPSILSQGFIESSPYYIMTYVNGRTFEQALFEDGLTISTHEAFTIIETLLLIVKQMHEKKIVHRDLRIPNILLVDGQIHIIDFGLATKINSNKLTLNIKNPKKIAHPISDLYAIGHFLLFLLYSSYIPTTKRSSSWQKELQLPLEQEQFIERLLTIGQPFLNCNEALQYLYKINYNNRKNTSQ